MRRLLTIVVCCAVALRVMAQASSATTMAATDSIRHIQEVVVTDKLPLREIISPQVLSGDEVRRMSSLSVADAMRYFSGIQLKDYGGVGGLKTVDIRSMGSAHLGVFYDGIELGNAQNGQIDLGQFSLDNVEQINLYNGQKSSIFQPATDFCNAAASTSARSARSSRTQRAQSSFHDKGRTGQHPPHHIAMGAAAQPFGERVAERGVRQLRRQVPFPLPPSDTIGSHGLRHYRHTA